MITPEIPQLDPKSIQVRKHALLNEISAKPSRRWWRLAVPATVLAAAAVTATVLWPVSNPSAYASWTAEPRAPGPDADTVVAECRARMEESEKTRRKYMPNFPAMPTEVSVVDQRGDLTQVVFTGPEAVHTCLRSDDGLQASGGGGGIVPLGSDRYRAMSYGKDGGNGGANDHKRTLTARVSAEVGKVRVTTHDGRHVIATIGKDGWLVAWWPGESDVNTVTLYDKAGKELGTEPGGVR